MKREPYLETDRLYLCKPLDEDYVFVGDNFSGPSMTKYSNDAVKESAIENLISRNRDQWNNHNFGINMIVLKENSELIGCAGVKYWPPDTEDTVDLGFGIMPEYQGKGYAFEASSAIVKDCFERHNFPSITCHTSVENIPSIRLIEKLGFERIKVVDVEADGVLYKNIAFFNLDSQSFNR